MKTKTIKRSFFKIGKNKVIYPAKAFIRFFARLFDYLIGIFPGALIASITMFFISPDVNSDLINAAAGISTLPTVTVTEFLQAFTIPYNNGVFLLGKWLIPIGLLTTLIIIPMVNIKRPGQSLGKMIFKITPLYMSKRNNLLSFSIREAFIFVPLVAITIANALSGTSVVGQHAIHQQIINISQDNLNNNAKSLILGLQNTLNSNIYAFTSNILTNTLYYGVDTKEFALLITTTALDAMAVLVLVVLLISTAASYQKMGLHDMVADTSVVDLRSITKNNDAELDFEKTQTLVMDANDNSFGPKIG